MADNAITRSCKFEDAEDIIVELYDEYDIDCYEIPADRDNPEDDSRILSIDGEYVLVPEYGVVLRSGSVIYYDEDEEGFTSDFSVTLIYKENESDPSHYLWREQDSMLVTLFNYLRDAGTPVEMSVLEEAECIIHIDGDYLL